MKNSIIIIDKIKVVLSHTNILMDATDSILNDKLILLSDPSNERGRDMFETLYNKLKEYDNDLGVRFRNQIFYVSYIGNTLTWKSCTEPESRPILKNGYSTIKQFVKEIYSSDTRIKAIKCDSWQSRLWKWAEENNALGLEYTFIDSEYIHDDYGDNDFMESTGLIENLYEVKAWNGLPDTTEGLETWEIYLTHFSLDNLPKEVGMLKNLIYLNLTGNYLTKLPKEICELEALETLILTDNPFDRNPEYYSCLDQLRSNGVEIIE